MTSKVDSRQVGLVAGYNPVNYFLHTRETASKLDIMNPIGHASSLPTFRLIGYTLEQNHPSLARLLRWKYHKKIKKINRKYASGERNSESFARSKVYRLLLLKKPEY